MQGKLHLQSQQKNRIAITVCDCNTALKKFGRLLVYWDLVIFRQYFII